MCGGWGGAESVWDQVSNFPTVVGIIDLIPSLPLTATNDLNHKPFNKCKQPLESSGRVLS